MSRLIFGCYDAEQESSTGWSGWRPGMLLTSLQQVGPTTKNSPAQNVNSVEVERNPGLEKLMPTQGSLPA